MGLKGRPGKHCWWKHMVKIRPLWDWKQTLYYSTSSYVEVKIRPLWDWKVLCLTQSVFCVFVKIRPLWDWKRSFKRTHTWLRRLKSDHCGIERGSGFHTMFHILSLKSDHCGIESQIAWFPCGRIHIVKIRPLWDWKGVAAAHQEHQLFVKIRPLWDWKWVDMACMSYTSQLKSDHCGIERGEPLKAYPLPLC